MAEVAPLTSVRLKSANNLKCAKEEQAHAHGRKAALETQQIHWTAAAEEHQNAAQDYAKTARTVNDGEALRVLRLLEQQHRKLAEIIKSPIPDDVTEHPAQHVPEPGPSSSKSDSSRAVTNTNKTSSKPVKTSALSGARVGSQARDTSPSLARDIASRRGIPQTSRPSPAAQARARQLSPESSRRRGNAPRIPPSVVDSQASLSRSKLTRRAEEDDGFTKFYSGLTTGTMSKLSSVLAYAGLPLAADDIKQEPTPLSKAGKHTVSASNDPDVRKLFSKAALAAVEEDHRQRGTFGRGFGPAESFYVVPTTGMTKSFADIARHRGIEEDEDDFVDAQEAPGPPSPIRSRIPQSARASFGKGRTQEELELENTTLKVTLEQLAGRLANFEVHAQDASMAALTQSMVAVHPPATGPSAEAGTAERVRQLEELVSKAAEEKQQLEMQARQQQNELKKWNTKYQKLYERARSKQQAKQFARKPSEDGGGGEAVAD
ncbi:hypothetical protein LTR78_004034 [Recurvomyces mirabilis]|uniref:Uncharacterized protein n=1 Tax=Recurvomyces mirabilis TaxID=574656 RepID=A0AAE0WQS3_9PEZI|nr:hypothetical protein LTR78_004034 [Recurvomyces mirabilis]KAK5153828.1 hypothetical protein LTS14_007047 [Recurvomyces mirabilis]